jgi:hypothetical protein
MAEGVQMKKKLLSYTILGILTTGALGSAAVYAQTDTTTPTTSEQDMQAPVIKGSIPLNKDPMAQYLALAKVSMADAVAAAQKAVSTTEGATSASLEDENGYLVWSIVVAGQEVKVDAGTAEVLVQTAMSADEMDNGDEQNGSGDHMDSGDEQGGESNDGEQSDSEQGGEGNN